MSYANANVLVLNRSWVAVCIISARQALGLLFRDAARILDPNDFTTHNIETWKDLSELGNGYIQGVNHKFPIPSIVVLNKFDKMFGRTVRFSRRNIFARDKQTCQYCGSRPDRRELTLDHVLPKSRGGKSTWDNIVLACVDCNTVKSHRTPREAGMRLLSRPKKPAWLFYVNHENLDRHDSWQHFVDKAYWNTKLEGE